MKSASGQTCTYEVTVVTGPPCPPDPWVSVSFEGINDLGQACGWQAICGEVGALRPIVWTNELGMVVLPLPEGAERGQANDINNVLGSDGFGQVVCTLQGSGLGGERGLLYDDGKWTMLPPENGSHSGAFAINDAGQVAGYRDVNGMRHAFIWQDGMFDQFASPIGGQAYAYDVSPSGDLTGSIGIEVSNSHAFRWTGGLLEDLGSPFGGIWALGDAIGAQGIVAGLAAVPPTKDRPFGHGHPARWDVWNAVIDLGLFPGTISGRAKATNDADQLIGSCFSEFGAETSFLWQDGELLRLDDLVDLPPELSGIAAVNAINNKGQIAGRAGSVLFGGSRGIILTPTVPLGDVNLDCEVDGDDLVAVLDAWGPCDDAGSIADIVTSQSFQPPADGVVDGADLAVVLGNWTERSSSQSRRK